MQTFRTESGFPAERSSDTAHVSRLQMYTVQRRAVPFSALRSQSDMREFLAYNLGGTTALSVPFGMGSFYFFAKGIETHGYQILLGCSPETAGH